MAPLAASMPRLLRLLTALALPVLGGCVHYHPEKLEPERTLAAFEERSLSNTNLQQFLAEMDSQAAAGAGRKWDLDTLTLVAFYYHPNLDLARAQWNSA